MLAHSGKVGGEIGMGRGQWANRVGGVRKLTSVVSKRLSNSVIIYEKET